MSGTQTFALLGGVLFMTFVLGLYVVAALENVGIARATGRDPRAKHIEATGDGVAVAERMAREGKL